jgi:moderate conductance mechanosensitive channel
VVLAEDTWVTNLKEWHVYWLVVILAWLTVGLILSWLARVIIRRIMHAVRLVRDRAPGVQTDLRTDLRIRTVRGVLTSTALAFIWVVVVSGALNGLGISLSGFVVWATVIGGAIGFGAQQVVRDLLAGFFLLTEDQYGVGDTVDLGHATGKVEQITLRVTKLRDTEGRVWFVPHGQIVRVANLSHDWAQAVLDVPIPIDADIDAVSTELRSIGQQLLADGTTRSLVLGEPQVLGVQDLSDDRAVLRMTIKTEPGGQFEVLRVVRRAIAEAEKNGRLPRLDGTQTVTMTQPPLPEGQSPQGPF